MDANSAINFATRTEQVSERKVGFNGTCILFKHMAETGLPLYPVDY